MIVGIISASAALVTAVTGLVVAIRRRKAKRAAEAAQEVAQGTADVVKLAQRAKEKR